MSPTCYRGVQNFVYRDRDRDMKGMNVGLSALD